MRSILGHPSNRSLTVAALLEHWNERSRDRQGAVSYTPGFRPRTTSVSPDRQTPGSGSAPRMMPSPNYKYKCQRPNYRDDT